MKTLALLMILSLPFQALSLDEFNGAGSINGCSGALFIMEGMQTSQKALLITNGHCIRLKYLDGSSAYYPAPGQFIYSLNDPRVKEHTSILLQSDRGSWTVLAEKLLFATMTGTDFAVYELESTYLDLEVTFGLRPFVLESMAFQDGEEVLVHAGVYNRGQSCRTNGVTQLREGPYYTNNALRFSSECSIYMGFSGALVLRPGTRNFAALANTHFDAKAEGNPCDLSKPCEVENGVVKAPMDGQSYGVPVSDLYQCLENQNLNFRSVNCPYRPKEFTSYGGTPISFGDALDKSLVAVMNKQFQLCSGVFVAPNLVLTAAHCVIPSSQGTAIGRPGDWVLPLSLPEGIDPLRGIKIEIVQTLIHPNKDELDIWLPIGEDKFPFDNPDLALLVLKEPYKNAVPARIDGTLDKSSKVFFAGFGLGVTQWQRPDRIQFRLLDGYDEIQSDYSDLTEGPTFDFMQALQKHFSDISNYFYFVKPERPGVQTLCYGDSGGPLYMFKDGELYVFGVASMYMPHPSKGNMECNGSFLNIFSKIEPHKNWLAEQLEKLSPK